MRVRFLGVSTRNDGSPTLYATDRHSYIAQGWKVADGDEGTIEIPHTLLAYLERGTCLSTKLTDTGKGTFLLSGAPVTDPEMLAGITVPDHEQCIEVPMGVEIRPDDIPLVHDAG